ncbi:unnamed protein product [Medioppia subpectinata]|uniref:Uncharacterized protein n=1 Tax=Medioppia subpectinata TaxID=1979941 RepID=A0A7R9L9R6_9ACAR|nr:unnamed protein product [Medioppia subpectinata]CAG2116655.1 unnamed protein product [Medioppia subpectinata]
MKEITCPLDPIYGFSLISSLENLEILENSSNFVDISDETLLAIVSKCHKLRELLLALNTRVTDQSIAQIPQHLPQLSKLCITDTKISDYSLAILSELKSLVYLDISGSSGVTDAGVESMVDGCRTLEFMQLNRCEAVTAEALRFCVKTITDSEDRDLFADLVVVYNGNRTSTQFGKVYAL